MEEMSGRLDRMEKSIDVLQGDVEVLKADVRVIKADIRIIQDDVNFLKDGFQFMCGKLDEYLQETQRHIAILNEHQEDRLARQGEGIRANRDRLDDHESRIQGLEAS